MSWQELHWLQKLAWKVTSTHPQDLRRYLNVAINDGKASSAYPSHSEIRTQLDRETYLHRSTLDPFFIQMLYSLFRKKSCKYFLQKMQMVQCQICLNVVAATLFTCSVPYIMFRGLEFSRIAHINQSKLVFLCKVSGSH